MVVSTNCGCLILFCCDFLGDSLNRFCFGDKRTRHSFAFFPCKISVTWAVFHLAGSRALQQEYGGISVKVPDVEGAIYMTLECVEVRSLKTFCWFTCRIVSQTCLI